MLKDGLTDEDLEKVERSIDCSWDKDSDYILVSLSGMFELIANFDAFKKEMDKLMKKHYYKPSDRNAVARTLKVGDSFVICPSKTKTMAAISGKEKQYADILTRLFIGDSDQAKKQLQSLIPATFETMPNPQEYNKFYQSVHTKFVEVLNMISKEEKKVTASEKKRYYLSFRKTGNLSNSGAQEFDDVKEAYDYVKKNKITDWSLFKQESGFHSTAQEKYLVSFGVDSDYWRAQAFKNEGLRAKMYKDQKGTRNIFRAYEGGKKNDSVMYPDQAFIDFDRNYKVIEKASFANLEVGQSTVVKAFNTKDKIITIKSIKLPDGSLIEEGCKGSVVEDLSSVTMQDNSAHNTIRETKIWVSFDNKNPLQIPKQFVKKI